MDIGTLLVVLVVVSVIGVIRLVVETMGFSSRLAFVQKYVRHFDALAQSVDERRPDLSEHTWLLLHLADMEAELGPANYVFYRGPAGLYTIDHYPYLSNTLHKIPEDPFVGEELPPCRNMLVTHWGALRSRHEKYRRQVFQPWRWLGAGLDWIVDLPRQVIYWVGLGNYRFVASIVDSPLFRLLSAVTAAALFLYNLLGNTMQVTLSWDAFRELIRSWLQ